MKVAKLLRFYPGLSYTELMGLDPETVEDLWQAITVIESQEVLLSYRIATFPNMKAKAQRDEHKRVFKEAYPPRLYPPKTVSIKDLDRALHG